MSSKIIVGPLLGFENGDYYTVCLLLNPGLKPILRLPGLGQNLAFISVAQVGKYEFWRAEFKLPAQVNGLHVDYVVEEGGATLEDQHGRAGWQFFVPGTGDRPLIAYASCNGFSSVKLVRDTDEPYRLWKEMAERHTEAPFSLLLMGGDQVYADEIWESKRCPSLQKWSELNAEEQIKPSKLTGPMRREIAAFYDWLYTDRWCDVSMSLMLATIPSIMMWDDHDIFDGWGSYPEKRQTCEVFKEIFNQAGRVFDLFQLRGASRNRIRADRPHRTLALRFRDYHILVLDNRSERTMKQVMSEENWWDIKGWLNELDKLEVSKLLVMTGVPVVYRSFATVEAILDTTPWQEEIEDDVHDHWTSRSHMTERMRLVMVLLNFLDEQKKALKEEMNADLTNLCKLILLSGDVHVGALGQLWNGRKELGITQVISTGIVHPPPSAFQWAGVQLMTSDTPEPLGDGDVTAEMLTPFGSPRYLRTRNFATLQTGTDKKIWINWVCENEKWKPSFAIS